MCVSTISVVMTWRSGFLLLLTVHAASFSRSSDIRGLRGKGDYREILVSWEYPGRSWFVVHFCELQAWGSSRCKAKTVESGSGVERNGSVDYSAELEGLRMATNYTVTVEVGRRMRRLSRARTIIVATKGFSARAVSCLPEASEVEVETGPYFHGRIGVESGSCSVEGDPSSSRTSYILRIGHKECGSEVNETAASTFVLVQESSHILTHSTRRFLVLCTFQPETLTVRAGLNLPQTADGMVEPSLNDISENEVHASPLRQEDRASGEESQLSSVLGAVAALLGLAGTGLALWKYLPTGRTSEAEGDIEVYDNLENSTSEVVGAVGETDLAADQEESFRGDGGPEEAGCLGGSEDPGEEVAHAQPITVFI